MLRARCRHLLTPCCAQARAVSTQPNPPLRLDPSLQALLKDVDISLQNHKQKHVAPSPRELEIWDGETPLDRYDLGEDSVDDDTGTRKSPAAHFGSLRIGAVTIPSELQASISALIEDSSKAQLRADAKRLFLNEADTHQKGWDSSFDGRYKSRHQREELGERDGTAFATVVLPAHFSAIYSVLDHLKQRLGTAWKPQRVIDWYAGTGSGLWAAVHALQATPVERTLSRAANTTIAAYTGIDKRGGLASIAKRLAESTEVGGLRLSWQRMFHEMDRVPREEGSDVVALSAFALSALKTTLDKRQLVKEMWESGAGTIILIDHNGVSGFESIAQARDVLLNVGRKEIEDPETVTWPVKGCHVVAPCPHDKECPLHYPGSTRPVCGFSQRIQRPDFVRKTKHSGVGHEDIGYSYVVIRRGVRPTYDAKLPKLGRVGQVGRRGLLQSLVKLETTPTELVVDADNVHSEHEEAMGIRRTSIGEVAKALETDGETPEVMETLRQEAFGWPRLVFPPLKRSGHVILDACTPQGKIMRLTVPKSQGKQPYYDARKSEWGDLFPHEPKSTPVERHQPKRTKHKISQNTTEGIDTRDRKDGKQPKALGGRGKGKAKNSYSKVTEELLQRRKEERRARVNALQLDHETQDF